MNYVTDETKMTSEINEKIHEHSTVVVTENSFGRLVAIKDLVIIEYVAIRIIGRDDRTFYSEYSMHQPNRHESLRDRIKKITGKKPVELGVVEEGFKTDEGVFLTRRKAMDLYREGKLRNRLDFRYGKPDDKDMQSIYLW